MFLLTSIILLISSSLFLAAPTVKNDADAKIIQYENVNDGSGNYHFSFETSNGIYRKEKGTLVNPGQPDAHIEVLGTVSYSGPDGKLIYVKYLADENGYHISPAYSPCLLHDLAAQVKASFFIVAVAVCLQPTCCGLGGQLKKYVFNNNGLGTYSFEYETQDGTFRREDGGIISRPGSLVVRGEYGYIDPSGRPFALRYIADANGFRPQIDEDTRFNDRKIY